MGYPKCFFPEGQNGETADPAHCECSKQSILYILEMLLPGKQVSVEIMETVLDGAQGCRFAVTVESEK